MKVLKIVAITAMLLSNCFQLVSQSVAVQNQFFVNPYIYNPAFAGDDDATAIFGSVKKQWLGVEGSPTLASLSIERPLKNQFSLAGNLTHLSEGPFNNMNAFASASYGVQISKSHNQRLYFGLSLGVRWNYVNLSKFDDPDDLAVTKFEGSEFLLDGAFGFRYTFDQLTIGVSSPRLASSSWFVNTVNESVEYDPFARMIYSASYSFFPAKSQIELVPHLLYHVDTFGNQLEGMLIANYDKMLSLGAGYRANYGGNFMAGFQLRTGLNFNYFYTISSGNTSVAQDSHELVVGYVLQ